MDKFVFHISTILGDEQLEKIKAFREVIVKGCHIMISLQDTYLLWTCLSGDFDGKNLLIPAGLTPEEYIREKMSEYGCIIHGGC